MKLEIGKTYRRDDACWPDAVAALRKGDDVERWYSGGAISTGGRGVLKDASMAAYAWVEFTVRHLAPREPDWAGAAAIIDRAGDVWTQDGSRYSTGGCSSHAAEAVEREYGPCLPLIDADGRVVIDTVAKINTGKSPFEVVYHAVCTHWRDGTIPDADRITQAVLDALGGGDRG